MTFGERLKLLRNEKNMTQADIAEMLNVGRPTIAGYETKGKEPNYETLAKLSEYFNVSIDFLLGKSDIRNPYKEEQKKEVMRVIPEHFTNAKEARLFVKSFAIFGSNGFDANKLDDDEILNFANELLEHMDTIKYKYKK